MSPESSGGGTSTDFFASSSVPSLNRGDSSALKTVEARVRTADETRSLTLQVENQYQFAE